MPTLYKHVLNEGESVWLILAKAISEGVFENRRGVLERLNFHEEHGRPGDADGKFDEQIKRCEDEVLAEIAGVLAHAFARAAEPRTGVIIATLEWIKRHPSKAQDYALPGFAEWSLAPHYQRAGEDKGTYFPDVMGFVPIDFHGTIQIPDEESVVKAASAAIHDSERRPVGRPFSESNRIVGEGLREIYLRYNDKITRRSETSWRDGGFIQVEAGPFYDFVSAAIVPLQTPLSRRRLPPVTAEAIVRQGHYPISRIKHRFYRGPGHGDVPDSPHPAATQEFYHGQPEQ
jgi:hypothetical protein